MGKVTGVTEILLLIELLVVTKEIQNSEGHLLVMTTNQCPNDMFKVLLYVFLITSACRPAVRSRHIV
jgi:succinate dehydrogenase hydrophobic anchor subunit